MIFKNGFYFNSSLLNQLFVISCGFSSKGIRAKDCHSSMKITRRKEN